MRAVQIQRTGGPEVLQVVQVDRPEPGPGQALVRVAAIGVNFAEALQRQGTYPSAAMAFSLPTVLGSEAAGTVESLGPETHGPEVGARIAVPLFAAMQLTGAYTEYLVCDATLLVPIPDSLSFETATALMVQGLTAHFLTLQTPPRGRTVLVHAAAGGVGSFLVQLARHAGAKHVVATAGGERKLAFARALGADAAVDYLAPDWPDRGRDACAGVGPDIIFDAVGGDVSRTGLDLLAPGGTLVTYGALSSQLLTLGETEVGSHLQEPESVTGFALYVLLTGDTAQRALAELFQLAEAGDLQVPIGGRYPLDHAAEAHRALQARETPGKLILVP